ncbi:hypothetical protein BN1723_019296, partial [Verticillium longisporum]
QAVP